MIEKIGRGGEDGGKEGIYTVVIGGKCSKKAQGVVCCVLIMKKFCGAFG